MTALKFSLTLILVFCSTYFYGQCPAGPGGSCDGSGTSLELYWIGTAADNSGNWNAPCSWRVGSTGGVEPCQAPRSIDNVYFTSGSFPAGGSPVITINTQARCNNFLVQTSVDAMGHTPEFNLINPGFLQVYGDFRLRDNLIWTVVGGNSTGPELFFKSTSAGNIVRTGIHVMGAVQFDGFGGEWKLNSEFNAGSLNFVSGYLTTTDGVDDYDMNLLTFDSDVPPAGTSANRRIDLNSSTITMTGVQGNDRYPFNTTNAPQSIWECRETDTSDLTFNAGTSKIIFTVASPFVRLGGLNYNVIQHTGTGRFYDHFGPDPCNIDTLETDGYLFFHHEHIFNVLKINSVSKTHNFFKHQTITGDLIASGSNCKPTEFKSEYNRLLTMPASVSADPMVGYSINNLRCDDGTAGHAVSGFSQGITTGWTISAPAPRDLYWVGDINDNWSNPRNWSESITGAPTLLASDCPPIQTDNVFFVSPLVDGDNVKLNAEAFCNNQVWNITAPATATLSGNQIMNVFGNLTFDEDMIVTATKNFEFWGRAGQTVFSAGKTFPATTYFWDGSDYTLLDDLNFNFVYLFRHDTFSSGGFDMTGKRITFRTGSTDFSGSTITLNNNRPWYIAGGQGTMTYDASSHVILSNTSASTEIYGWGNFPHLPNFTLQSPNTQLYFRDHFKNKDVLFDGDVILNGSARFRADLGTSTENGPLKSLTINGDLTLGAGKTYDFDITNPTTISGSLTATGTCDEPITIQGVNGEEFDFNAVTGATFDYCNISDLNSTNAHIANLSLDLGNNTNLTFVVAPATTFYWRALNGSCGGCNFDGDWTSTAGYWSTDPLAVEGVPSCIPGPYDNIVFDNLSFSGGASSISLNSTVSCHDLSVTGSNVSLSGTGTLKITGSVFSDGTASFSSLTGSLDFVSNDVAGETIDFGAAVLGSDVNFANESGAWTLTGSNLEIEKALNLQSGTINTNDKTVDAKSFYSSNNHTRTLNLSTSEFNITGPGAYINLGAPANVYTWNTIDNTNLTINKGTSIVNFTNSSSPVVYSDALDLHHVNFTSTNSIVSGSPVLLIDAWDVEYMKFDCSGRLFGSNSFDTLHFTDGNVYILESGETQTFKAPDGRLYATGSPGSEIGITSTNTGVAARIRKLNTGGSVSTMCFDYLSVEDNFASSDDNSFKFFTGVNSNDISSTGIWDFTRPAFVIPTIESDEDQTMCKGGVTFLSWDLTGSGPYNLSFTANGGTPVSVTIPHGIGEYKHSVAPSTDTEYEVTIFEGDNCGLFSSGTVTSDKQTVFVPAVATIAQSSDSATCTLINKNQLIHLQEGNNGTDRPIVSVLDRPAGIGLGSVTATIEIDGSVQSRNGVPYLQRRFGITAAVHEDALVRLYFTQAELDALSTAVGESLHLSDLVVSKYDNDVMDFTGDAELLEPTTYGAITAGITSSSDIKFVEIAISSFSHFVIHSRSAGVLPIELLSFEASVNKTTVDLQWKTAVEINNDYFTVERSMDGVHWDEIILQDGAGNSTEIITYNAVDYNPLTGVSYYRLKQTDFDGEFSYSSIEQIRFATADPIAVVLYPNPTDGLITIEASKEELSEYILTNVQGQIINSLVQVVNQSDNKLTLDLSRLPDGLYIVKTKTIFSKVSKR